MSDLILHHYDISAFSERVRLAMGLKGLRYRSVLIPPLMPKRDLTALTGGYRRAPVLQIGADIYCDSLLILRDDRDAASGTELVSERNGGHRPRARLVGRQVALHAVARHRRQRQCRPDPTRFRGRTESLRLQPRSRRYRAAAAAATRSGRRSRRLARDHAGRRAPLPPRRCAEPRRPRSPLLDLAVAHARSSAGRSLLPLDKLDGWYERVTAIGHGASSVLSSTEALAIARDAEPAETNSTGTTGDFARGENVVITPDDTGRDPVVGTLMSADAQTIVIQRTHAGLGRLNLHFEGGLRRRSGRDVTLRR